MIITPNFETAVEFSAIQPGTYKGRLSGSEVKTAKSGDTYVNWTWTLFDASGDYASANGREVQGFTMVTGKGAGSLKTMLKAIGVEPVSGQALDVEALYGKEAQLVVKQKRNQDGTLSDWVEVAAVRAL